MADSEGGGRLGFQGAWSMAVGGMVGGGIFSTLFATARLAHEVARAGELPSALAQRNESGVPGRAVVILATLAAVFASLGGLSDLVESASLAFLVTFTVVSGLAFVERAGSRWVNGLGVLGAGAATGTLLVRLAGAAPVALAAFAAMVVMAVVGRPLLRGRLRGD